MKFEKFKPENYKNADVRFTLRLPENLHQEISTYSNKHIEYAFSNREDK